MKSLMNENTPNIWVATGMIAFAALILWAPNTWQLPTNNDFWGVIMLAAFVAYFGMVEVIRYLRWRRNRNATTAETKMQENVNKSLPKWHFWYGIASILLAALILLIVRAVPPASSSSDATPALIILALIAATVGTMGMLRYLNSR